MWPLKSAKDLLRATASCCGSHGGRLLRLPAKKELVTELWGGHLAGGLPLQHLWGPSQCLRPGCSQPMTECSGDAGAWASLLSARPSVCSLCTGVTCCATEIFSDMYPGMTLFYSVSLPPSSPFTGVRTALQCEDSCPRPCLSFTGIIPINLWRF